MHGFTIDNLLAIEAVLPDGKQIVATKDNEHSDFLWACKGGGGNFGIVTKFTFQTHKLPNNGNVGHYLTVYITPTAYQQKQVLKNLDTFMKAAPDTTNCAAALPCGAPVCCARAPPPRRTRRNRLAAPSRHVGTSGPCEKHAV